MDVFEKRILAGIRENHLIAQGSTVITGVSGGADSVCLLRVLTALRHLLAIEICVVHIEHGLRGQSALEDEAFVRSLCSSLHVSCHTEHVNVRQMAEREGLSLEEAGRKARYECFERCRIQTGADRIAVAHHAQDQAETVLLNLCRGSGVRGLGGMRLQSGYLIRPLLEESRDEIEAYLKRCGQDWRTDETNFQDVFARNRIRSHVLPQLIRINPRSMEHICRTALFAQKAEEYLERQAAGAAGKSVRFEEGRVFIDIQCLMQEEDLLREYILRSAVKLLKGGSGLKDIGFVHVRMLEKLLEMPPGAKADLPDGITAQRTGGRICLNIGPWTAQEEEKLYLWRPGDGLRAEQFTLEGPVFTGKMQLCASSVYGFDGETVSIELREASKTEQIEEKKYTKWLSYDTMKDNLCLRTRQPGDYLVVNAAGGKKKLKDYLIDEKIPAHLRSNVLLLAQGSHILWAAGLRISEAAKVTSVPDEHRKVICIQAGNPENV